MKGLKSVACEEIQGIGYESKIQKTGGWGGRVQIETSVQTA